MQTPTAAFSRPTGPNSTVSRKVPGYTELIFHPQPKNSQMWGAIYISNIPRAIQALQTVGLSCYKRFLTTPHHNHLREKEAFLCIIVPWLKKKLSHLKWNMVGLICEIVHCVFHSLEKRLIEVQERVIGAGGEADVLRCSMNIMEELVFVTL